MISQRMLKSPRSVQSERPIPKTRQLIKLGPGRTRVLVPAPERNHVLGTSAAAVEAKPCKR